MEATEETTSGNGNGADTAEPMDHYVEKVEAAADKFADFKIARILAGDLRDTMLEILRAMPKTWAQMTESEQTARAYAVSDACRKVVRESVALLETEKRVTVECLFQEVAFKDKGKIVAKFGMEYAGEDTRIALTKAQGKEILIVVADAAQYMGQRAPAAIDKQQPELPIDQAEAEHKVDADLDTILAGDASERPAGRMA